VPPRLISVVRREQKEKTVPAQRSALSFAKRRALGIMIQTKKIGGHMKLVFLVIVISLIIPSVVFSDCAAPYTKEAVDKIYSAQKSIEPPKYDKKESNEERQRRWVEYNRNFFQKAGYNYDDTINAVVNDMRYHPERIPKTNEWAHG
jgi:hypothetical protein